MWLESVVWYSKWLKECGRILLCNSVSVRVNVIVLYGVILWGSVPMWPWYFIWYCQCLYQWGRALLCDTVSAFTDVAMLRCLYFQCLRQCGSALWRDSVSVCINNSVVCCVLSSLTVPMCQGIFDGECYYYHRGCHFSGPLMTRKNSLIHTHIISRFFSKIFTGKCIFRPNKPT